MQKAKDVFFVALAALMLIGIAFQGISYANDPDIGVIRNLSVNPCKIQTGRKGPLTEIVPANRNDTELLADPTLFCSRTYNKNHTRVYWVSYIEKYNSRYKQWMTYKGYPKALPWKKDGLAFSYMAPAAIRCDSTGIYRVKVKYWTADPSPFATTYPSAVATYKSPGKQMCENTPRRQLKDVNNPVIVRLR